MGAMSFKKMIAVGITVLVMGVCGTVYGVGASPADGTCELEAKIGYKIIQFEWPVKNNPFYVNERTGETYTMSPTEDGGLVMDLFRGTDKLEHGHYSFHMVAFCNPFCPVSVEKKSGKLFNPVRKEFEDPISELGRERKEGGEFEIYQPEFSTESVIYLGNEETGELYALSLNKERRFVATLVEGTEELERGRYHFHAYQDGPNYVEGARVVFSFKESDRKYSDKKAIWMNEETGKVYGVGYGEEGYYVYDITSEEVDEFVAKERTERDSFEVYVTEMGDGVVYYGNEETGKLYAFFDDGKEFLVAGTDELKKGRYRIHTFKYRYLKMNIKRDEQTGMRDYIDVGSEGYPYKKAIWMDEETGRVYSIGHGDDGYYVYETTPVKYEEGMKKLELKEPWLAPEKVEELGYVVLGCVVSAAALYFFGC